jgi:hypothetical protein
MTPLELGVSTLFSRVWYDEERQILTVEYKYKKFKYGAWYEFHDVSMDDLAPVFEAYRMGSSVGSHIRKLERGRTPIRIKEPTNDGD